MASSRDAVIHELLFRLASVYIDRLTNSETRSQLSHPTTRRKSLKSADDLVQLICLCLREILGNVYILSAFKQFLLCFFGRLCVNLAFLLSPMC